MKTQLVIDRKLNFVVAAEVSQLNIIMELAEKHHWSEPLVWGKGGMINTHFTDGKWRYEPLLDDSTLPSGARKRIDILKSINPQGFIIGHEIEVKPRVKPLPWVVAPEEEPMPLIVDPEMPNTDPIKEIDWEHVGRITWDVAKVVGIIALATVAVPLMVLGAFVGCATDPVIFCVTQEGLWVEIYCFYS
jgi:hypothetical protein